LTTKVSRQVLPRHERQISFFLEVQVVCGEMPFMRAAARTKGLKADPGCRWPCVARLKGVLS
jgi:hypothetical protein